MASTNDKYRRLNSVWKGALNTTYINQRNNFSRPENICAIFNKAMKFKIVCGMRHALSLTLS